jgi:hypothetical protein
MTTYTTGSTWWIGPRGITVNGSSLVGLQLVAPIVWASPPTTTMPDYRYRVGGGRIVGEIEQDD